VFFTDDQFAVLQKLSDGVMRHRLTNYECEILNYFDREGLTTPRAYIADGYYTLTEKGKSEFQQELIRKKNIRREQEEKEQILYNAVAEKADRKAEKRADRIFQISLAFLNTFLSLVCGILIEHFGNIIDSVSTFVELVVKFFE
jgi:hypothetical protein